jgi:hypothetical protein
MDQMELQETTAMFTTVVIMVLTRFVLLNDR